jgi:hypothetical protein
MSRPAKVPKAEAVEIITKMRAEGYVLRDIAKTMGVCINTVSRYVMDFKIPRASYRKVICPHCGLAK